MYTLLFVLANWLLWMQYKFGVFPIYKLDNHMFIIIGAVTSQRQTVTVTTFNNCMIYYNVGIFTNLDNIVFKILSRYFVWNSWYFKIVPSIILLSFGLQLFQINDSVLWLTLTFLMISKSLVIFSFAAFTWLRLSISFSIWLQ